jgi:hypothetical protein
MNMRSTKILVILAVLLVIGVLVLDIAGDDYSTADGESLLPDLETRINDIDRVVVQYADATVTIGKSIGKSDQRWVVRERDDYAADTGALRQVLIALRDAQKLEQKTANPAMHDRLGLSAPGEGDAIGFTLSGEGFEHALVVGNVAQQSYRYLRFADEDQTWLIDQNPEIPDAANDWLAPDIVDTPSSRIQSVSIVHSDDEQIHFAKNSADDSTYTVADIPEGRELSYAGVVNGIAGVLQNLDLDDVRKRPDELPDPATTSRFTTFDGLQVTARSYLLDDETWVAFEAEATEPAGDDEAAGDGAPLPDSAEPAEAESPETEGEQASRDEAAADVDNEQAADDEEPADAGDEPAPDDEVPPSQQAADLNADVGEWLYRLPDHKTSLLQRRWDELLKAPAEDEE